MKKLLYAIAAMFLMALAALIAFAMFYIANPDFAAMVNDKVSENRTVAYADEPTKDTSEDTGIEDNEDDQEVPTDDENSDNDTGLIPSLLPEYIAPDENDLDIPDGLDGLTGFELPEGEKIVLPDEDADRIEQELSTGPTGDGLDFDPLFYPYYNMLDDQLKHLYRQIYANANEGNAQFKAVEKDVTQQQVNNAFTAVLYDHPELIWLDPGYMAQYRINEDFLEMDLMFNSLASDRDSAINSFNDVASSIISGANGSDYDKEKYVHDRLAEMNDYRFNSLDQSAYSALIGGETICAGYSKAFSYILTQMGIPCYVCAGSAGGPHGWNIVCLDGEYYNVDITWDDTEPNRICNYDYFNKSDSDYGYTHIRQDLSVYLPPCNGEQYKNLEPEVKDDDYGYGNGYDNGYNYDDDYYNDDYYNYYDDDDYYFNKGREIGDKINDTLNGIDWDEQDEEAGRRGRELAEKLNEIIRNGLPEED